ncbi:hypothetical protein [Cellulomonas fimi]|uniref:hypothetical protein n=1 Tax=Cellulomonas fimi TaxID=1708 RepID=UPI002892E41B|nr:hypothetical protein [Cellulomonas fimi]
MCTRDQLHSLGVSRHHVRNQVAARRWRLVCPDVVALHRGPLDRIAAMWAAALACPPGGVLGAWTALELAGLDGWYRQELHVVIARGQRPPGATGVVVHESRRHVPTDGVLLRGLPVHPVDRAAVDAAAWSRSSRTAVGLLAAVVQQGLSTADRLGSALELAGKVRHRRLLAHCLADIDGGSQSLAEIDFVRFCRDHDLPEPRRQVRRQDSRGRWRYLDVEWQLADGRTVAVEIDGIGHMEATRWYDDLLRSAELPHDERRTLIRLPATAVRIDGARVARILRRHLGPHHERSVRPTARPSTRNA